MSDFKEHRARRSQVTANSYGLVVQRFAKTLKFESPESLIEAVKKGEDPVMLLDKFVGILLMEKQVAPKTMNFYVAACKSFLRYSDVKLDEDALKNKLILPPQVSSTSDRGFTDPEIRTILLRSTLKSKTVFLLLLTTGGRIGEISKLKISSFDFEKKPPRVSFAANFTKTKKARTSFLTVECAAIVKEYLGERIKTDSNGWLFPNKSDSSIPMAPNAHIKQLTRLIEASGLREKLDPESRWYQLHIHCCRKTFYSKCLSAGVQYNIAEAWLGHKIGLDSSYERQPEEVRIREWSKVESSLTFLSSQMDGETKAKVEKQTFELEVLRSENVELREN